MAVPGKIAAKKLSSSMSRGSGEDFELFCQPCDHDDIRLPAFGYCVDCAEHLCESCFVTHRRPKPLRHHQLLNKNQMPQTLNTSAAPTQAEQFDDLTTPCTKHNKERIKFYCQDHKELLCSVCVTLEHTGTSCDVNYIPDISGEIIDSKEYRNTLKQVQTQTGECQKIIEDLRNRTAKSNSVLSEVLALIQIYRQKINQRVDELETKAIDKAKKLNQVNDTRLQTAAATCVDVIKVLKASSDSIKQLNTSEKADKLFIELKHAEKLSVDHEKIISQLVSSEVVKEPYFELNQAVVEFLHIEKSLGISAEKSIKVQHPQQAVALKPPSLQPNIRIKTSKDKSICQITGLTVSSRGKLLLADCNNYAVKMLDTESQTITQQLTLDSRPWDITTTSRDELAVTMPEAETIQFVSFSSANLSKKNTLKVNGRCCGISCYQGKLAVSFSFPEKLQIMDLQGNIQTTVTTNWHGGSIFSDPGYVTSTRDCIYVSVCEMHAVIRLNWQGEQTGSHGDMGFPEGLSMLEDGSLLVCDSHRDKCNIQNVSGDVKTSTTVLKALIHPRAICWCKANGMLYVSANSGQENADNYIQVYKLS